MVNIKCLAIALVATVLWTVGGRGAIRFDGVDDYMFIPTSSQSTTAFNWTNELTVAFWAQFDGDGPTSDFIAKGRLAGTDAHFFIRKQATTTLVFYFANPAGFFRIAGASYPAKPASEWRHCCLRLQYGQTNTWHYFFDGVKAPVTTATQWEGAAAITNADQTRIGGNFGSDIMGGQLEELAMWNAYLDDAEVYSLAKGQVRGLPQQIRPAKLVGYWPMDQGQAFAAISGTNAVADFGPYGISATPLNSPQGRPTERLSYP